MRLILTFKLYMYLALCLHGNKRTAGIPIECTNNCTVKSECDVEDGEQENAGFPEKNCYCDPLCPVLRDCCHDYKKLQVKTPEIERAVFECVYVKGVKYPIGNKDRVIGVTMVTRCQETWPDDVVKRNCESGENSTILMSVPVLEPRHDIVFKNMYCAICNTYDEFVYWTAARMCLRYGATDCFWVYEPPNPKMKIRMCPLHITDTCAVDIVSDDHQDSEIKCENGDVSLVYSRMGTVFRNEHCALCNGIVKNNTFCECLFQQDKSYNQYGLTMIVDLNSGYIKVGNVRPPMPMSGSCKNKTMYDPIKRSCIPCESSFAVKHGVCRHTNRDQNTSRFKSNFTFDDVNVYLSMVTLIVSLGALATTFVIYAIFKELHNTPGKILMCLIIALFVADLLFLISSHFQSSPIACKTVSIVMHYFFLAAFCWMNIMSFDLGITFSSKLSFPASDYAPMKRFLQFSVYGWCVPLVIVCIAVIVDFSDIDAEFSSLKPGYGTKVCWITSRDALVVFFFGPLALFKLFDVAAFIFTSVYIFRARRQSAMARQNTSVCTYFVTLKLSLVMGLTWTIAFLANSVNVPALWYVFVILNGLQGLFIGLGFLGTNKVRRLLSNMLNRLTRTQSSMQMSTLSTLNH